MLRLGLILLGITLLSACSVVRVKSNPCPPPVYADEPVGIELQALLRHHEHIESENLRHYLLRMEVQQEMLEAC